MVRKALPGFILLSVIGYSLISVRAAAQIGIPEATELVVQNEADSGEGSLRYVTQEINDSVFAYYKVNFAPGVNFITLGTPLPPIAGVDDPLIIRTVYWVLPETGLTIAYSGNETPLEVAGDFFVDGDLSLMFSTVDAPAVIAQVAPESFNKAPFVFDGTLSGSIVSERTQNSSGDINAIFIGENGDPLFAMPDSYIRILAARIASIAHNDGAAYGLAVMGGRRDLVIGTMRGSVEASAVSDAYALGSFYLSDTLSASAVRIDRIEESGNVSALSATSDALGIAGYRGVTIREMNGVVRAESPATAIGVLASEGALDITLSGSGTISARTTYPGTGTAYAVLSANYRSGILLPSDGLPGTGIPYVFSDRIELRDSASLEGGVDLAFGNDLVILGGEADISAVPLLEGGGHADDGGAVLFSDTLRLDGWKGSLDGTAISGWEILELTGETDSTLGPDTTFETSPLLPDFPDVWYPRFLLVIDPGSRLRAAGGRTGRYRIEGNVRNAGILDLRDPGSPTNGAGDRVTVTDTYTGTGAAARLGLDVALGGGDRSDIDGLDVLVVGEATGLTGLCVQNISAGDLLTMTTGNGILVVRVNGSSDPDAFFLDDNNDFGDAVSLVRVEDDGDGISVNDDWYLVVLENGLGGGMEVPIPEILPPEGHAAVQGGAVLLSTLIRESLPRFHERQVYSWQSGDTEIGGASWWSRTRGTRFHGRAGEGNTESGYEGYAGMFQAGADFSACACEGTLYRAGLSFGQAYGRADIHGGRDGSDLFTLTAGTYASIERPRSWYAEGVIFGTRYDLDIESGEGRRSSSDTYGYGASLEGGLTWRVGEGFLMEPQVQVVWQRIDPLRLELPEDQGRISSGESLLGRLGLTGTVEPDGWSMSPFFEFNAIKEFGDVPEVEYEESGEVWRLRIDRLWLGGAVGLSSRKQEADDLEFSVKAGIMAGVDGYGERNYHLEIGLRKSW